MLFFFLTVLTLTSGFLPARIIENDVEYVSTPVGYRPKQCVHTPEEKNHIIDISNELEGITIYYPDSDRSVFHPTLPECLENAKLIEKGLKKKKEFVKNNKLLSNIKGGNLGDGWQIYGGWYPPSLMGNFSVNYTVPNEDMPDYGQIMYYFIGMQNNDDRGTVTIIQPVITYCNSGCDTLSAEPGWSGTSWNCCPGGQSWFSKPIALSAGDTNVLGWAYSDSTKGNVQIYTGYNGKDSLLTLQGDTRQYDWVDVTLEAYNYGTHCDAFNQKVFGFYNMQLMAANGNSLNTPDWNKVNNHLCNGEIDFTNNGLDCTIIGDEE